VCRVCVCFGLLKGFQFHILNLDIRYSVQFSIFRRGLPVVSAGQVTPSPRRSGFGTHFSCEYHRNRETVLNSWHVRGGSVKLSQCVCVAPLSVGAVVQSCFSNVVVCKLDTACVCMLCLLQPPPACARSASHSSPAVQCCSHALRASHDGAMCVLALHCLPQRLKACRRLRAIICPAVLVL
jgi:hypothetical protein